MRIKIRECILFLLLSQVFVFCRKDTKELLAEWEDMHLSAKPTASSMDQLARIGFHHSYRESSWDPQSKTLFIEYGGSSALTFSDSTQYVPLTKLDLARKASRVYSYGKRMGLEILRVSLVKPFYVKDSLSPETEIQEFEVYRIRITPEIWDKLPARETLNLFEVDRNDYPVGSYFRNLEWLIQNWEEELNEFSRIEVK